MEHTPSKRWADEQFTRSHGDWSLLQSQEGKQLFRVTLPGRTPRLVWVSNGLCDDRVTNDFDSELAVGDQMPDFSAAPVGLTDVDGSQALLLADPGGRPLRDVWEPGEDLRVFLQLAASVCRSVGIFHNSGFLHGDVRPENILATSPGHTTLIGAGSARSVPYRGNAATEISPATLPYLAPERTGRLEQLPDTRSDVYSLGVTLYEILTGRLPFTARTPREWIHSHLARAPLPPGRWVGNIPSMVAGVILKAMSKDIADRYQTVEGLEADLDQCRQSLSQHGRVAEFPLGTKDYRGTLIVPDRLYGRDQQLKALHDAFKRVCSSGKSEMLLVCGPAGTGKSALVRSFRRSQDAEQSYFAQGKFDQFNHLIPFSGLASALRDLIRSLEHEDEPRRRDVRSAISATLGTNASLITPLIPELGEVLGELSDVPDLPPTEAHNRFQLLLAKFLTVFAVEKKPLLLFLDDLQWVDSATLNFVKGIVGAQSLSNVLVIGAVRDDEVQPAHPLFSLLTAASSDAGPRQIVRLPPLETNDVLSLVSDSLGCAPAEVAQLADAVQERGGSNPLFATQLLRSMVQANAIQFNESARRWEWQLDTMDGGAKTGIVDLISWRLTQLAEPVRVLLGKMSLLGGTVTNELLAAAFGSDSFSVLDQAVAAELITRHADRHSFFHDRVQEAAFRLVSMSQRQAHHLELARTLKGSLTNSQTDFLFEVVQQYLHGLSIIETEEERRSLAELCLAAGKKSEKTAAYAAALDYYRKGTDLARSINFEGRDKLLYDLETRTADSMFLLGDAEGAEELLSSINGRTKGTSERARIAWSRITIWTARGSFENAVILCLDFLGELGLDWSLTPSWETVLREFEPIREEIAEGRVNERLNLPVCESEKRLILEVLVAALPPAVFYNQNLVCLILCRMANISRQSGNTGASAMGYAYFGALLGPLFGEYQAGFAFGKVGLDMVETPALSRFRGRVAMTFAYHVLPYSLAVRDGREIHRGAMASSRESGDLTYVGYCSCTTVSTMLFAGDPLADVEAYAHAALQYVSEMKFGLIIDIITSQLMLARCLRGSTSSLDTFSDGAFDEVAFEATLCATPGRDIAACWHWIRRLESAVLAGRYCKGLEYAAKAEPLLWTSPGHLEYVEYALWHGVCIAHSAASLEEKLIWTRKHAEMFSELAKVCPENFASSAAIVAAEVARLEQSPLVALQQYDKAATAAARSGLPHLEALANELAAQVCGEVELDGIAAAYRKKCYSAYRRWGASGKLRELERLYPELAPEDSHSFSLHNFGDTLGELDVQSVMQSSATVAGETFKPKMIRSLFTILLENAAARRGVLVIPKLDRLQVEAEAYLEDEAVRVVLRGEAPIPRGLPEHELWRSFRTQEVIEIIPRNGLFQDFAGRSPGGAFAVPLVTRGKSIGIVYLETELRNGVVKSERASILKLIASQAAVGIENALLEEKETLLREVHHRVKNNLQLITSLLNLQASHASDPKIAELFKDSRNRVRSMALVHENLYRAGDFSRISMKDHLHTLCSSVFRAYGIGGRQITLDVEVQDGVQLDLDQAIPCGLIVNELVSNCLKHAFPEPRAGSIEVRLRIDGGSAYELEVRDDGIGMAARTAAADTLGLQLVRDLVDQLRGAVEITHANGTAIRITFSSN